MILTFLKNTSQYFIERFSVGVCLMCPHEHFWQEWHKCDVVFFPVYHSKRCTRLIFFMTQHINFDHLVEMAPARFLHCRVTMFALPLIRMCMEDTLGLYKYSIISKTCSLLLPSSDVSSKIIIIDDDLPNGRTQSLDVLCQFNGQGVCMPFVDLTCPPGLSLCASSFQKCPPVSCPSMFANNFIQDPSLWTFPRFTAACSGHSLAFLRTLTRLQMFLSFYVFLEVLAFLYNMARVTIFYTMFFKLSVV